MKARILAATLRINRGRIQKLVRKTLFCRLRAMGAALVAGLLLLCTVSGEAAEPKTAEPQKTTTPTLQAAPATAPSGPAAIPVADIATQATEVANLLQAITQKLGPSPQVEIIRELLLDVSRQIDQHMTRTVDILRQQPTLSTLQAQQQQWQQMQMKITGWLTVLTKRSNTLQDAVDRLTNMQKTWEMTLKAAQASKAPGPILQQISGTLVSIKAALISLQTWLASALDLQSSVSDEVSKCGTVLAKIAQVRQTSMSSILVQNSLPIGSPELWADARTGLPVRVRDIAAAYMADFGNYFHNPSESMPLHAGILAVLTLLFLAARHQVRKRTAAGETLSPFIKVFDHPVAAALMPVLFIAASPNLSPLPATMRNTSLVLALAPIIILVRPVVSVLLVPGIYALGLLFAIDAMREIFSGEPLIGQGSLILESLAGMAVMIWFLRNLRSAFREAGESSRIRLLETGSVLVLLVLASGLAAAAMGYVRLARLTTPGIIAGGVLALALYASLRAFIGIVAFSFHVWPLRALRMVLHNRDLLERRIYRVLVWGAVVTWIIRYLSYIGLLEPVVAFGKSVLDAKFERGSFSISPSSILEFVFTVWASYLLSAFIRFVLQEDVYSRMRIASGKSYAVSSLLHYFILALGFTAAIAAMGVNLTKLTVLTGAFGVGIGFGLQGVVNNFVSGLILLFERPIHVGDTVEVGDLLGKVRRIGIRASTVHTRQGADIIVPNSQLVTEKVTNWTLSDQLRRIDLPVGVNYSAAPAEVIKILVAVASANPNILKDPEPQGLFTGFGDSSINFELRAWTDHFDDWPSIRSELAIAVYDAVYAAGMTFPFPQREVRLLRDPEGGAAAKNAESVHEA